MKHLRLWPVAVLTVAMTLFGAVSASAGTAYKIVNANGQQGWNFKLGTGATGAFVNGPATPPMGVGSAHLATGAGHGDESAELRNKNYNGKPLSQLKGLSYWTYVHHNNGQQAPYLILDVSSTGGKTVNDLLFFEPAYQNPADGSASCPDQGTTALDRWQGWDAFHGCWYALNAQTGDPDYGSPGTGVQPLAGYLAAHPNAKIVNPSSGGGVRVLVGFASDTDTFDANIDAFRARFGDNTIQYDFEPA